ncbi:phosphatidylethanolamine-binding protein 4 [Corynascus novoguineensis]|uniref:Phosphatidylethanolamine-binding protein 4 n=1 Tax=Corynascus novoguineensis TaxID=1126955 RepID=A0AAN7CSD4_9PEZI|nr:phosphatidylethanolamine-binding protein 4 [Corynascus novoguineensis]
MLISIATISSALLLAGSVSAQTPPGFVPEVENRLEIIFGSKVVEAPGADLGRADTANQPTLGTDAPLEGASYLWAMIDIDVPSDFQNPSAGGPRTTYLHALITGFTPTSSPTNTTTPDGTPIYVLTPPQGTAGPVAYVGPAPPPENPPHAHQYVSLLYETAADFVVTPQQIGSTIGFDVAAFAEAVGLDAPVRAGYFNVTG